MTPIKEMSSCRFQGLFTYGWKRKIGYFNPFSSWLLGGKKEGELGFGRRNVVHIFAKKEKPSFSGFSFPEPSNPHYKTWEKSVLEGIERVEEHNKRVAGLNK